MKSISACAAVLALLQLSACSHSNNLIFGRVEATVGGHDVVVTDCYRTSVPPPEQSVEGAQNNYRFAPCRDADVQIRGGNLVVNGRSYGPLNASDSILVDHGVVSVQRSSAGKT